MSSFCMCVSTWTNIVSMNCKFRFYYQHYLRSIKWNFRLSYVYLTTRLNSLWSVLFRYTPPLYMNYSSILRKALSIECRLEPHFIVAKDPHFIDQQPPWMIWYEIICDTWYVSLVIGWRVALEHWCVWAMGQGCDNLWCVQTKPCCVYSLSHIQSRGLPKNDK